MLIQCPSCPAKLQRLTPGSGYIITAVEHAAQLEVPIPDQAPAVLTFAALVSHAMVVHDELDLGDYLDAYLNG